MVQIITRVKNTVVAASFLVYPSAHIISLAPVPYSADVNITFMNLSTANAKRVHTGIHGDGDGFSW